MVKVKWALMGILLVLVVIVALQNMTTVETRILFLTVSMPRAVLLLSVMAVGFVLGVLASLVLFRRSRKEG